MIKKTITYDTFEGAKKTGDFFFHMNQVEFSKLNGEIPGGLEHRIQEIMKNEDEDGLLRLIDLLVSRSYGKVDEVDGEFTKIDRNGRPLFEKFVNSDAYDKLIIELIQGEKQIIDFLTGIMPAEIQKKMKEEFQKQQAEGKLSNLTPLPGGSESK